MTRNIDLEEWLASRSKPTRLMVQLAQDPDRRRRKPRDPVEAELLERSAIAAVKRRQAEGRLVRTGPRRYELRER